MHNHGAQADRGAIVSSSGMFSPLTRRQCLIAASGLTLGACAPESAVPSLLRSSDVHPADYPTVKAVNWISEQLSTATQGRLRIKTYHSGQLGRESDALDLVRLGALDITRVFVGGLTNIFDETTLLCLPFYLRSKAHLRSVLDGAIGASILDRFSAMGLVGLAFYDSGARNLYTGHRAVETPNDLVRQKIRAPNSDVFIEFLRALGANPTPLAYSAVYSALETRLIDGAENNLRSYHSSRHFEAAKYFSLTEHSFAPDVLVMSRKLWLRLGKDDQALVQSLARQSVTVMRKLWDEGEDIAQQALSARGVQMISVDRAAFAAAVEPMLDRYQNLPKLRALADQINGLAHS